MRVIETQVINADIYRYQAFPSLTVLPDGTWLCVYNHCPRLQKWRHPPHNPEFRLLAIRSTDQGASWSEPYPIPQMDWYGTEDPGIVCLHDGRLVLTNFRFRWHSAAEAIARWRGGEDMHFCIRKPDGGMRWQDGLDGQGLHELALPYARSNDGTFAFISDDGGFQFGDPIRIATAPYRSGYTRVGAIELADGRLAYAVGEHFPPHNRHIYLLTSEDRGESWLPPTLIASSPGRGDKQLGAYNEPCLLETSPGKLLCILRDRAFHQHLFACRSVDGGVSWTEPEQTPMFGHPGHLLRLADSRILCSYGHRQMPFGIRLCVSDDEGQSWDTDNEFIIRDDMPNGNLGYPCTIAYAPDKIYCMYYGETQQGVTCLQASRIAL